MKFSQLIKYNMRNIFIEKSYTKCGGETGPRPFFSGKLKLRNLWINSLKLFLLNPKLLAEYIKIKLQTTYCYLILSKFK